MQRIRFSIAAAGICLAVLAVVQLPAAADRPDIRKDRFFEMRTYYAAEGKADDLDDRFRNHTNLLFQKHGMTLIGFWHPVDKKDVLVYILAYPSREAREKSWKDFEADPMWQAAKKESERKGKLVNKVESVFMSPTDFSPIR